jgi:hypothetical protein
MRMSTARTAALHLVSRPVCVCSFRFLKGAVRTKIRQVNPVTVLPTGIRESLTEEFQNTLGSRQRNDSLLPVQVASCVAMAGHK